jgi:Holliday junction resolvasome RuvABC endonuclease subunit
MLRNPAVFLGIDPGLHGALVVYDAAKNTVIDARVIPSLVVKRNGKQKRLLDIPTLVGVTRTLAHQHPEMFAFMELVGAHRMHGRAQGGSSMFSFGVTNGAIETALVYAGIPYAKVTPSVWKKALECTQDKDDALERANQLIPSSIRFWTPRRGVITKEDCKGVGEAALIAYFGSHFQADRAVFKDLSLAA